jgi:hypothetical protein
MKLDCLWGMTRIRPPLLPQAWRRLPRRFRSIAPGRRARGHSALRALALAWAALGLLGALSPAVAQQGRGAVDNGGQGLLPIGDQYPTKLLFLTFTPEPVLALPAAKLDLTYQFSVANTIVNTQTDPRNGTPKITQTQVDAGLSAANFPTTGFGAYFDMETQRHLFRVRYGLGAGFEAGLDQAWISFGGGMLDANIEAVEGFFHGQNPERQGFARNQFHYYLFHDGRQLVATSSPVDTVPQDPVFSLKWNLTEGGEMLPAVSVRLAYKAPLDAADSNPRNLVSSGHDDYGYSLMLSKAIGKVVVHLQVGESQLSGTGDDYVSTLRHQFFGLEYRYNSRHSWIAQTSNQTSALNVGNVSGTSTDFQISRPADVFSFGYKYARDVFHMDLGFSEDYNSRDNTTDIVLFFDLGWRW